MIAATRPRRKSRGISTYSGAHRNNDLARGPASAYACRCGEPAHEWALRHDASERRRDARGLIFSTIPNDYMPMCRGCHRRYDKEKITHCPHGHEYTKENTLLDAGKRKCKTCVYARNAARRRAHPLTPEQKARKRELARVRRSQLLRHIQEAAA